MLSTFPWNWCPPSAWITVHFAWNTHHFSGTLPLIRMGESFHRVSMLSNKYLGNLYSTMSLSQNHVSISPGWRQGPAISRGFIILLNFRWVLFGRAPPTPWDDRVWVWNYEGGGVAGQRPWPGIFCNVFEPETRLAYMNTFYFFAYNTLTQEKRVISKKLITLWFLWCARQDSNLRPTDS
jgi:hypothetical protein